MRSPARADLVAALGETTGDWALRAMRQRMAASPTGRQILVERPRITVRACLAAASSAARLCVRSAALLMPGS